LDFLASGNYRWQENTKALQCFEVELAVAPGFRQEIIDCIQSARSPALRYCKAVNGLKDRIA